MKLGAIVVVGGESGRPDSKRPKLIRPKLIQDAGQDFLGDYSLACLEIAGRSMVERTVERLIAIGVEDISVVVVGKTRMPVFRSDFGKVRVHVQKAKEITPVLTQKLKEFSADHVAHAFVVSANAYAETDMLDFFYFHLEAKQAATRAFDRQGPLALWVVDCSKADEAQLETLMIPSEAPRATYFIRDYVIRLNHPRDLRQFAEDTLRGRCESRPSGRQIRPGVWMDERARVNRKARIVAPVFIGRGSEVKADAVVTRFSTIEKDCCIDCGTVVENSSILQDTNVGIWLDVCRAVVCGNKIFSLDRNVAIEISDATLMRSGSGHATHDTKPGNKVKVNFSTKNKFFTKEQSAKSLWPDANIFSGAGRMSSKGPVIIMELPEQLKQGQVKTFMRDLQPLLDQARPCVVLDCSKIQDIDSAGVEMLLQCLELAMKRDGDLKLAAVSPASAIILELMRVDRLFEVFDTPEEATRSFQTFTPVSTPQSQPWYATGYGLAGLNTAN